MDRDADDTTAILEAATPRRRWAMLYDMRHHLEAASGMPAMAHFADRLIAHGLRCWLGITPDRQDGLLAQYNARWGGDIKAASEPVPGIVPPGPWEARGRCIYEKDRRGPAIAFVETRSDATAIVRLIVASPRLKTALTALLEIVPRNKTAHPACVEARAALASAAVEFIEHALAAE